MVKTEDASGIEKIRGLSEEEAASRIKTDGYNELPTTKKRTLIDTVLEVMKEPMFILLVACGSIYLLLGDVAEAGMLLCFVFVVIGITIYQERKVERAIEALRDLSSPRALVIRDGQSRMIPGREVVRGDAVLLAEGDRVPADAVIISSSNLLVDESLLSGESAPVRKSEPAEPAEMGRPGGDDTPFVYSSTLVVQGHAVVEVKGIGLNTEVGRIGRALESLEPEQTPLQKETQKIVKVFASAGLLLCALVVVFYGWSHGDWLGGFLAGLTLAMALMPEEIPVVMTIFLALGAWRMSQRNVLTRRLHAIQTLGSTTVLCVDKTGTLTLNKMTVRKIFSQGRFHTIDDSTFALSEEFHELVEFSVLASQRDPFDPIEKAIRNVGVKTLSGTEHLHDNWNLVHEYALSKKLLALSHVWQSPDQNDYVIASKGAPEAIFDLCHMEASKVKILHARVQDMARAGLRILGVARANFKSTDLPTDQHEFKFEFMGLLGFHDPVRPEVNASVQEAYAAGIRVIMITGDYPVTAQNIAQQAGINPVGEIITGPELDVMSDDELKRRISHTNVFARVVPEQKLRIVEALKANSEVVLMSGDGVNDAPALKSAHIGIAMGGRGTEVARESADLVLLDDNFTSIVQAVKTGRRIFDNLKKAVSYIFAIHVPIAGMSLIPIIMRWPTVLHPAHIAFLELIIDPVCSIVFEAEPDEKDVMNRPPRRIDEPVFDKKMIVLSILQGFSVLFIVALVFIAAPHLRQNEAQTRAIAFTTLVIANLCLILTNRSWSRSIWGTLKTPNKSMYWVFAAALTLLALTLYIPFLSSMFKFGELHTNDLILCALAGILSIMWFEAFKYLNKRYHILST